jgi:hypothetical protein
MEDMGADFLVTGEVLNQRPMSQTRQSLDIVKRESGYSLKILRPLCAKNLPPTEMENDGLVDRERLLDIQGKTRKVQMGLADSLGIKEYPSPAGGCKLTEPNFSRRLKDLYEHNSNFDEKDIEILKIGRHFRLSSEVKAISTRDVSEYERIKPLIKDKDFVFDTVDYGGSTIILQGTPKDEEINMAAAITGRYSKGSALESVKVKYRMHNDNNEYIVDVKPANDKSMEKYML